MTTTYLTSASTLHDGYLKIMSSGVRGLSCDSVIRSCLDIANRLAFDKDICSDWTPMLVQAYLNVAHLHEIANRCLDDNAYEPITLEDCRYTEMGCRDFLLCIAKYLQGGNLFRGGEYGPNVLISQILTLIRRVAILKGIDLEAAVEEALRRGCERRAYRLSYEAAIDAGFLPVAS